MSAIHLVRHARSSIDPEVPPGRWRLPSDCSAAALRDSGVLPADARWFTSPESKARQTAELLLAPEATVVTDLREAERSGAWYEDSGEFEVAVAAFLTDGTVPAGRSWESRDAVTERVVSALEQIVLDCGGRDCVLVSHGTALTLLVGALTGRTPATAEWRALRMPDHCSFEVEPDGEIVPAMAWGEFLDS